MTDTKTNIKKPVQSKVHNLKTAMLEFQKLALSATKGGKANIPSQGGKRTYARLEDVIEAVAQGNQFGLYFTQEIDYVYVSHRETMSEVVVVTTVRHINDETTYVSKLPIILSQQNMENPQKLVVLLLMLNDIHYNLFMVYHQKMMMVKQHQNQQST